MAEDYNPSGRIVIKGYVGNATVDEADPEKRLVSGARVEEPVKLLSLDEKLDLAWM